MEPKHWIVAGVLIALWLAETYLPFFQQLGKLRDRFQHDFRNLVLGAVNALLGAVAIAVVFTGIDVWSEANQFGLLRQFDWPTWVTVVVAVLLLDLWTYWWHRLNHVIPFLWRFHRTHHSDPAMDASTGVRFHTGEILLSWLARVAVLPLLGVSIAQLVIYESLLLPVVLLHHSNLRLPKWLDFGLLPVLVTPAMHRVHHSRERIETNSNYGSLFPWWDWLFGSLRIRRDVENIHYGLDEFAEEKWQTLSGLLRTPLGERQIEKRKVARGDRLAATRASGEGSDSE